MHDPDPAGEGIEEREDGGARGGELKGRTGVKNERRSYAMMFASMLCVSLTLAACSHSSSRGLQLSRAYSLDSVLVAPTQAVADIAVPPGEIDGIVVDAYSGEPIVSVPVFVRSSDHSSRQISGFTDPYGHFVLKGPPREYVVVESRMLGYLRDTVAIGGKLGHFVRFGLRRQRMVLCTNVVTYGSPESHDAAMAISVFVRDARTNAPPSAPVTLHLRDGSYSDSVTMRAPRVRLNDSLVIGAGAERQGVYDVEVAASGYAAWRLYDVPIAADCQGLHGRTFPVWLLPIQ
jgi:hypothetical protein